VERIYGQAREVKIRCWCILEKGDVYVLKLLPCQYVVRDSGGFQACRTLYSKATQLTYLGDLRIARARVLTN
jgi:hypothetical protein